jgi:hypothetical protein
MEKKSLLSVPLLDSLITKKKLKDNLSNLVKNHMLHRLSECGGFLMIQRTSLRSTPTLE